MVNIFNLFLFLLFFWFILMLSIAQFSPIYIIFGTVFSYSVSFLAYKLKLIEKKSELLYLSFNFYRHFLKIYFTNFFPAIKLILFLAFTKKTIRPLIYQIEIDCKKFHQGLLIASFDMYCGIFCVRNWGENFSIYALDEKYFDRFNLFKILKVLPNINEDNLI
ncbi:MAG TPA: hypothetical protein VI861_00265 [Rickettsiales bacterium]|nr:hypothetical protein [Rickettsiales bacterium]